MTDTPNAGAERAAIDIVREMTERGYAFDEDHQILVRAYLALRAERDDARLMLRFIMYGGNVHDISVNQTPCWEFDDPSWPLNSGARCADDGTGLPVLTDAARAALKEGENG